MQAGFKPTDGYGGQCSSSGVCPPEVSAEEADLALTAKSGTVVLDTAKCGVTDLCGLVKAVQAMMEKFD
jgi:hypothetical protein